MNATLLESAKLLPLPERVELFDALWESLDREGFAPQITAAQAAELDRRLEAHRRDPGSAIPWEQVKREASARFFRNP